MSPGEWETICKKCGKCCYEKLDLGEGVIEYIDKPCRFLDTETKLCKVYEHRHEAQPDCLSLTETLVRYAHWLPEDCAYVRLLRHEDTLAEVRAAEEHKHKRRRSRRNT